MIGPAPDSTFDAPPPALRSSLPLLLLAVGLLVTLGFALTQQSAARRERDLLFSNGATTIETALVDAIDARTRDFETSIRFISATYPTPVGQFEAYFEDVDGEDVDGEGDDGEGDDGEGERTTGQDLDPGVIFIEEVAPDELDALIEREQRAGTDGFRFTSFGLPEGGNHLVTTRSARPVEVSGVPIRGLDLSVMLPYLGTTGLPASGSTMSVIESDSALSLFLTQPEVDQLSDSGLEPVVVAMIGAVPGDGDETVGWALEFFDVASLIDAIDRTAPELSELSVQLGSPGMAEPVAQIVRPGAGSLDGADLRDRFDVTTNALTWSVDVWAASDMGAGTGLLDQPAWRLGIAASALLAVAAQWRQSHRRRLHIAEFELEHARALASTDPLTGLLNRKGLIDLARELPVGQPATLFFFDLDAFKLVNDARGHHAGDEVLRAVATSLRKIVRPGDYIARLGGDEFVIFVPGVTGEAYERSVSRRVIEAVSGIDEFVSCSLGVAARDVGTAVDVEELLRAADRAMYDAKRAGGGRFTLSG